MILRLIVFQTGCQVKGDSDSESELTNTRAFLKKQ